MMIKRFLNNKNCARSRANKYRAYNSVPLCPPVFLYVGVAETRENGGGPSGTAKFFSVPGGQQHYLSGINVMVGSNHARLYWTDMNYPKG